MNSDELRLRVECYVAIRRALGHLVRSREKTAQGLRSSLWNANP